MFYHHKSLLCLVILSLVGDMYNPLQILNKNDHLAELTPFINEFLWRTDKFRNVRNFFTHLDEVLTDMAKRGVNGPANTNCGIEYTKAAKGCVHLVWQQYVLHFRFQKIYVIDLYLTQYFKLQRK